MLESGIDCDTCTCSNGVGASPWRIPDIGFSTQFCPKQQVTPWSWYVLQLYSAYESGHLPIAGGTTDQPHKVMQAFAIIADRRAHNLKKRNGKKTPR